VQPSADARSVATALGSAYTIRGERRTSKQQLADTLSDLEQDLAAPLVPPYILADRCARTAPDKLGELGEKDNPHAFVTLAHACHR
jgi:hypothetical protein